MALGELQAEILGILQRQGKSSAREVRETIGPRKQVAYTTVSTILNRLFSKGLVKRTKVNSRGGTKYLYAYAAPAEMRTNLVQRALSQLLLAFGPSIVPTIYENLEQMSKEEVQELKGKISKTRR